MAIYKRGETYWYHFLFRGERIQETTGQGNAKRAAEMEEDRRAELREDYRQKEKKATQLGCRVEQLRECAECDKIFDGSGAIEVPAESMILTFCGRDCREKWSKRRTPVPTLKAFTEARFLPWAEVKFAEKQKTWKFYRNGARRLCEFPAIAAKPLDEITSEDVESYTAKRRKDGLLTSSINRERQVLRRMLALACEWKVTSAATKVKMLTGEAKRERVILPG